MKKWKYQHEDRLLSAKVGRDFSPSLGFPLHNWGVEPIFFEPKFRPFDQFKKLGIFNGFFQFGATLFLAHPTNGDSGIGVKDSVALFLL